MTLEEQLTYIENCNKDDFIQFAKTVNIFKTLEEPNYLTIKNKIVELLSKFNLTEQDILPDPRLLIGECRAVQVNINNI
jgi:hypothetical protein